MFKDKIFALGQNQRELDQIEEELKSISDRQQDLLLKKESLLKAIDDDLDFIAVNKEKGLKQ